MLKVRPKLKVLIVDDSELNREMLGSMLGNEYEAETGRRRLKYYVNTYQIYLSSFWMFKCRRWMVWRY